MGFQILNENGQAIPIELLDQEAAQFWKKEPDNKYYASPQDQYGNWFDVIGYKIDSPIDPRYTTGWDNVKHNLFLVSVGGLYKYIHDEGEINARMKGVYLYLKPYFELIDHWKSKKYEPIRTLD